MKITDRYLRDVSNTRDSPFAGEIASELLQRRREVRRLRRAMKLAVSLMRDSLAKRFPIAYMHDATAVISSALKPQRGGK